MAEGPAPELSPEQVVARVLEAGGSSAERAAEVLWSHASQRLRAGVGGETDLARLLSNELFRPLLLFERAEASPLEQLGESARQIVTLEAPEGQRVRFLFALSRAAAGERAGCWLISGLQRE